MRWPYRCEVEVLAEVKFSRAEDKKGCGMVEEDRCVIEGSCKHFFIGVRSVSNIDVNCWVRRCVRMNAYEEGVDGKLCSLVEFKKAHVSTRTSSLLQAVASGIKYRPKS